jgi:glycosyltransferase involved in cell wall biosynthesis
MNSRRDLVLIGNFLPDRQESMQRFAGILSDGLSARGWNVQSWRPRPRFANLAGKYRYGGLPKYLGYLDKFVVFPRSIQRRQRIAATPHTVYHIVDHSNAVYAPSLPAGRLTLTCHDLLQIRSALGEFPHHPVSASGRRYQQWILDNLRKLRRAVCISRKTRSDLQRLAGLGDEQTPVVYMGLNYPYKPMDKPAALEVLRACCERHEDVWPQLQSAASGFLLGVGGAHWYKNRTGLVSIFAELQKFPGAPSRLLYVGPPLDPEQIDILRRHRLESAVLRISGVSNEELRAAYSLARGLLFPSWEEGFGWPIAEAQACGCPVFTSNREPMTEIGGEAGCYIDPADPVSAASIISEALQSPERMIRLGLAQAARWDTSHMLEGYEEQYAAMIQDQAGRAAVTA